MTNFARKATVVEINPGIHWKKLVIRGGFSTRGQNFQTWKNDSRSPTAHFTPSCSSLLVPSFSTIMLFSLFSFALAEILSFSGLFRDEDGIRTKQKAEQFKEELNLEDDFDFKMDYILNSMAKFWRRNTIEPNGLFLMSTWKRKMSLILDMYNMYGFWGSMSFLSFKHQFAIGNTIGMISQNMAITIVKGSFFLFVASEILKNLQDAREGLFDLNENNIRRQFYNYHDDDKISESLAQFIECTQAIKNNSLHRIEMLLSQLENFRLFVRRKLSNLIGTLKKAEIMTTMSTWEDAFGTLIVGLVSGIVCRSIF